jgi:hypothetical protein
MKAVSVFSRVRIRGSAKLGDGGGRIERYQRDATGLSPSNPPAVPCLDPRCPLSRPPLPLPFLPFGGL